MSQQQQQPTTTAAAYFNAQRSIDPVQLKQDLASPDEFRKIGAVKMIIASMTIGKDMSSHFNDVACLVSSPNLELKKLVYLYLMQNAKSQPEKAVLQVSTFVQDTKHPSPLVRGIALRTMSSMLVSAMVDFMHEPLLRGLRDPDPYVKRNAAMGVLKYYMLSPHQCQEVGLLEMLLELLSDANAPVVAAAVCCIVELIRLEGPTSLVAGVVTRATTLLAALPDCTEWSQLYLLEGVALVFHSKHPTLPLEEAEMVINRIMPLLSSGNPAVALAVIKVVILFLMQFTGSHSPLVPLQQATLETRLAPKLAQPLVSLVSGVRPELKYCALRNVRILLQRFKEVMIPHLDAFFVKYDDPIYIKLEKIDIMMALATSSNGETILSELVEYAHEVDSELVRKAVSSIGMLAIKVEPLVAQCVEQLVSLIETKVNAVVQEAAVVVQNILRQHPNRFEGIIATLCNALDVIDDSRSKAAVAWVVGDYADRVVNAADILSLFLESFPDETLEVQLSVLTAIVKMYLKSEGNTAANQTVLERVLELATQSTTPDLRDRGFFYWRLILADQQSAAKIVLAPTVPMVEPPLADKHFLAELMTQAGSVASVFMKPSGALFGEEKVRSTVYYDDSDEDNAAVTITSSAPDVRMPEVERTMQGVAAVAQEVVAAPMRNVLDDLDFGQVAPQPQQPAPPAEPASPLSAVFSQQQQAPQAAPAAPIVTPAELDYAVAIDGSSGKGLEVATAWQPSGSFPTLCIRFTLGPTIQRATVDTLQINVNAFGIGIAQEFPPVELLGGQSRSVSLRVNCNNGKKPIKELQVAVKVDPIGVIFGTAPAIPFHLLLQPALGYDSGTYVEEFKTLQPSWQMPGTNGPSTNETRITAAALKTRNLDLIHAKEVPPLVGLHIYACTVAGQKLYSEVTVEDNAVVIANVRCADNVVSSMFGEYLLSCFAV